MASNTDLYKTCMSLFESIYKIIIDLLTYLSIHFSVLFFAYRQRSAQRLILFELSDKVWNNKSSSASVINLKRCESSLNSLSSILNVLYLFKIFMASLNSFSTSVFCSIEHALISLYSKDVALYNWICFVFQCEVNWNTIYHNLFLLIQSIGSLQFLNLYNDFQKWLSAALNHFLYSL